MDHPPGCPGTRDMLGGGGNGDDSRVQGTRAASQSAGSCQDPISCLVQGGAPHPINTGRGDTHPSSATAGAEQSPPQLTPTRALPTGEGLPAATLARPSPKKKKKKVGFFFFNFFF